jgi:glycine cleavage system H protein
MPTYYTEEHEWLRIEADGGTATVGITAHAAEKLGELVFLELKEPGETFTKGDEIGVIESVKAASEIYAPVDGEVVEANTAAVDTPQVVSDGPETDGWLYRIKVADPSQLDGLMDQEAYSQFATD